MRCLNCDALRSGFVGMEPPGQLAVRPLDLHVPGITGDLQDVVVLLPLCQFLRLLGLPQDLCIATGKLAATLAVLQLLGLLRDPSMAS